MRVRFTSFRNKNQIRLEKQKIVFQFALVLMASLIAGVLFVGLVSDDVLNLISERISRHFLSKNSTSFFVRNCAANVICVFALYLFSFSFINYVVSDIILAFTGLCFGIFSRLCTLTSVENTIYIFFKLLLLLLIFVYSCKIAIDSLRLKKILPNGRVSIENKIFAQITLLTAVSVLIILIINGLYCLF